MFEVCLLVRGFCFVTLLLSCQVKAQSVLTVEQQLELADRQKASAPDKSMALLNSLPAKLSPMQRDYRDYLLGFNTAIHSNLIEAISIIEPISKRHDSDDLGLRTRSTLLSLYAGRNAWSTGLLVAGELVAMLQKLPRNQHWHMANIGAGNFYIKLALFQSAIQLLDEGYLSQSPDIDGEMRCRYATQRLSALVGLSPEQVTPDYFSELEQHCLPLAGSVYSLEFPIVWAQYLVKTEQYNAVLNTVSKYQSAIDDLDYFYYWAALKNSEAQALYELKQFSEAGKVIDGLLAEAKLKDYRAGFVLAAELKIKLAVSQHDYPTAYFWRLQFAELSRFQQREDIAKSLAVFQAKAMQNLADTELALLASNQALLREKLSYSQQQLLNNYLFLALIGSALLITLWTLYRLRAQKRTLLALASHDALTGLANRRHFMTYMSKKLQRRKLNEPVSLILLDLDGVKLINDTYGHQAGDWVLQTAGKAIAQRFSDAVICSARVGGDEFVICLQDTSADKALLLCNQFIHVLADIDTQSVCGGLTLSASFGICDTDQVGKSISALISGADLAMYQAKKAGRHRAAKYQLEASS